MGGRSREQQRQYRQSSVKSVRSVPLPAVALSAGLQQDKNDRSQFVADGHRIAITGDVFYDFEQNKGGKGAIDLEMHLNGSDFSKAVETLGGVDLSQLPIVITESRVVSTIPQPVSTSKSVRNYLVNQRGIDAGLVDSLIDSGQIYSDGRGNAVFKYGENAAELRGTGDKKFRGVRGSVEEGFIVAAESPKSVVVVESAIDALSYRQLHGNDSTVIALGGNSNKAVMLQAIETAKAAGVPVVSAFDNDKGGVIAQANLTALAAASGVTVQIEKPIFKDWNDDLIKGDKK